MATYVSHFNTFTTGKPFREWRGVHAGRLRCVGRAPDGLRWEMGIRPGTRPLMTYPSGDLVDRMDH